MHWILIMILSGGIDHVEFASQYDCEFAHRQFLLHSPLSGGAFCAPKGTSS